ncbi:hypothetical protein HanRHA438_Chr02g0054991 [Helianthus annuus]|uniref:Uncharacterized protein n=1 Tax=Helianthus annuus TaxID=4232 RepID=A0A9K3NYR2_HELAN|nr:hypothetical protein HanXRQr2_Chr02g0053591 [Helianthus annuus]KAJ0938905.1 hypothetical protein HanRHA438_Chr02g0054991 [Helianthus annuus]KAJ0950824.1 hypothetical protein HanPSC8_Chr02g0052691 [Helianthus annuus]
MVIQGVAALSLLWFWDPTFQLGVAALSLLRFWDHIFQLGKLAPS